jgi:hypothetical protein
VRAALLAVVLLVSACASSSTAAVATPSPSSTAAASPVAGFGVACRLPVTWYPSNADADATNSGVGLFDAATGAISASAARPALHFLTGGPTYDAAVGRWLPVPASAVAPDGLQYAYAEWDPPASGMEGGSRAAAGPVIGTKGRVHLVDARTGVDSVVYSGEPTFQVVALVSSGILLAQFSANVAATKLSGLYLLNLSAGGPAATPTPVPHGDFGLDRGGWRAVSGGFAWGTAFTSGIETLAGRGNELYRINLATGEVQSWFAVPEDQEIDILGFAKGNPVVITGGIDSGPAGSRVIIVTGLNQAPQQLYVPASTDDSLPDAVVQDGGRLWFGGFGMLWLFDGTTMRHVPVEDPNAMVSVGGGCLA